MFLRNKSPVEICGMPSFSDSTFRCPAAVGTLPACASLLVVVCCAEVVSAKVKEEADRYTGVPAYGANFDRMGVKAETTAIAVAKPEDVRAKIAAWQGVVDEVIFRAIVANDTVEEHLVLLRAAKPA